MSDFDTDIPLTPSEVANLFGVDPKTVSRWAEAGKLKSFRTLGGHRRFNMVDVQEALKSTKKKNKA